MADAGLAQARLALRWLIAGEARAHPARFLLTALAIAVGVALGFAVHLVNGSASPPSRARCARSTARPTSRCGRRAPSASTKRPMADRPGKRRRGCQPRRHARRAGGTGELHPSRPRRPARRARHAEPDRAERARRRPEPGGGLLAQALFLSRAALAATGAKVGDTIEMSANGRTAPLRIAGTLDGRARRSGSARWTSRRRNGASTAGPARPDRSVAQ